MRHLKTLICLLALLAAALALPAFAGDIVITADTMEQQGPVLRGEGHVEVNSDNGNLKADSVRYDTATRELHAEGSVSFEDDKARITASRADINIDRQTGVLYDADILFKEQNYRVYGTKIEKLDDRSYFLEEGSLTTCPGPVPDWCVKGHNVELDVGKRLKSTNTTFRVKNVPILFTPFFWAPVVTERTTGLLIPEAGYSSNKGFTLRQPFYWAISDNRDATVFADVYTRRGVGVGAEYRYIEAPGVKGSMNFYNIRDTQLHRSFREVRAEHRHKWKDLRGFYDIAYVNQKDFYREYKPYLLQSSQRFLESQAEVAVHAPQTRFYVDARYLRELKDGEDQKLVVQKLPEAGVFFKPLTLGPVVMTADTTFSNFSVGTGTDGQRYSGDLTMTTAMGAGPTLAQSLGLGFVYYDLNEEDPLKDDSIDRGSVDYRAELRTSLGRQYEKVEHIVTPAISYNYRRMERGEQPPLFDYMELMNTDVNSAELSLTNRLRDSRGEFLTMRVSGGFDFLVGHDNLAPIKLDVHLNRGAQATFGISYDVNRHVVTESKSVFGLTFKNLTASGGHIYERDDVTMYNLALALKATKFTTLKGEAWYDPTHGTLERMTVGVVFDSQCWTLSANYTKRPDEHIIFFNLTLKGLGDVVKVGQG